MKARLVIWFLLAVLPGSVASAAPAGSGPARELKVKGPPAPPLVLYPACPCYRPVGEGDGKTRIDARVTMDAGRRAGLRLNVQVTDAAGKSVQTATVDASKGGIVGLDLQVPVREVAVFEIAAKLVNAAGEEVFTVQKTDVHVIDRKEAQVRVGSDGFLRVAGQRQFPIGMYNAGHYPEMAAAGFTATHNYGISSGDTNNEIVNLTDRNLKTLLDISWSNGMRMMVELPRKSIEKGQWDKVRRRVETFRYHPGLLCWGSEERVARGLTGLTNLAALHDLVGQLDPEHPLVLGDTRDVIKKFETDRRDMFPEACMDVGIWWWYPIPPREPDGDGLSEAQFAPGLLEPPSWLTTTVSKKPLWIAIQAYQKKNKTARYPTPAEYRYQAYESIISGVKGLFFYTGSGQVDSAGNSSGLLNRPIDSHWDYVQKLVHELREFCPVIIAPVPADRVSVSPTNAPVSFALRELDHSLYLIAANKSEQGQSVKFSGPGLKGRRVEVLYEPHDVKVEGDALADDFGPYGVHLYKLGVEGAANQEAPNIKLQDPGKHQAPKSKSESRF